MARPSPIEGDDELAALLAEMAEAIGATAVRLAPGSKPAYHAAAVLAAGGFVALLDADRRARPRSPASTRRASLAIYLSADRADARQRPGARHPGTR